MTDAVLRKMTDLYFELNPEKRALRKKASCCSITVTGGIYFEENMDRRRKINAADNKNAQRRANKIYV